MYGSTFVIWNRILLSLGISPILLNLITPEFAELTLFVVWYAFQAWIGGECLYICLLALSPSLETHIPNHMPASTGMTTAQFVAYLLFSLMSLPVIYIRPHKLKNLFYYSSATILIFEVVLLIWALATMGSSGFGDTISGSSSVEGSSKGWLIAYGIISTIGSIAAGILNQNDYARFAQRPRDAIMGQIFSFPVYAVICSIIGILVTAATQQRFGGTALWNLPDIFTTLIQNSNGGSRERCAGFFAGAALVVSQIGVNVPGNALSGGFDLAATFPRYINIRRGAYITALVSMACNPWRLVNTATVFISVLGSYSVFLGPMTGLMISSYFVVNKRRICVDDLFVGGKGSVYWYTWGVDWRAIVAVSLIPIARYFLLRPF
jgi:NCS1 family nucleobase:cation symporter-1